MKYIVAAWVLIICSMTGIKISSDLSKRTMELSAIISFFIFFKSRLAYFNSSVYTIVRSFSDDGISKNLKFINECLSLSETSDFPTAWKTALQSHKLRDKEVIPILNDFADKIGTSDAETQLKYLDYYISEVEKHLKKAEKQEAEGKKLYIILGLSFGLISAIMII